MKKKLIATLLTASLLIPTPVYAGTEEVPVTAHISESYTVTLPTSITLNNTKEQTYQVTVKGDIFDTATVVSVVPDETFTLQRQNSSNMTTTASVIQESTDWYVEEINADGGTTKEGTISVDELRAGEWEGELHFNISLSIVRPGLYNADNELVKTWDQLIEGNYIRVNGTTLSRGNNYSNLKGKLVVPESITAIGGGAFNSCNELTSIDIPNSVTTIGGYAFNSCNKLTSIDIPNSVTTIGSYAFFGSGLTSVNIPDSVTRIDDCAFLNCTSLANVNISDGVTTIGESAFSGCTNLSSVTIPNSVTTIDDRTFYNCTSLVSITIPNSVTFIGVNAFGYCANLSSVTIPNSVTRIGDCAFYNVPHIYYSGSATANRPWGALRIN